MAATQASAPGNPVCANTISRIAPTAASWIAARAVAAQAEADAAALNALVERQRHAAVGDALAFGTRAFECPRVDLAAEMVAAGRGAG